MEKNPNLSVVMSDFQLFKEQGFDRDAYHHRRQGMIWASQLLWSYERVGTTPDGRKITTKFVLDSFNRDSSQKVDLGSLAMQHPQFITGIARVGKQLAFRASHPDVFDLDDDATDGVKLLQLVQSDFKDVFSSIDEDPFEPEPKLNQNADMKLSEIFNHFKPRRRAIELAKEAISEARKFLPTETSKERQLEALTEFFRKKERSLWPPMNHQVVDEDSKGWEGGLLEIDKQHEVYVNQWLSNLTSIEREIHDASSDMLGRWIPQLIKSIQAHPDYRNFSIQTVCLKVLDELAGKSMELNNEQKAMMHSS